METIKLKILDEAGHTLMTCDADTAVSLVYTNCYKPGDTNPSGQAPEVFSLPDMIDIMRPKFKAAKEKAAANSTDTVKRGDFRLVKEVPVEIYDSPSSDMPQTCYLKSRTKPKLLDRMLIIEYGIERHVDLLLRGIRI